VLAALTSFVIAAGVSKTTTALIAAVAALLAAVVTAGATLLVQRAKDRTEATRAEANALTEQLGKLYGPLRLLTEQSLALSDKLREYKPVGWHLLGHLAEVVDDDADGALAEQIIAVNHRIEDRIFEHAGLLYEGQVPQSFVDFLGHHRSLSLAYDGVKNDRATTGDFTAKQFATYPAQFDQDVKAAYIDLVADRKRLLDQLRK